MKLLITFTFLMFSLAHSSLKISAQISPKIGFKNYYPIWSHVSFDSLGIDTVGPIEIDGYQDFQNQQCLFFDNNIYVVSMLRLNGMFIEKIETKSGKLLWTNVVRLDPNNNDTRENHSNFYINLDKNLEILTFRGLQPGIWYSDAVFGRRVYDAKNGELLYQFYADTSNSQSANLIYNHWVFRKSYLLPDVDNNFHYISLEHFEEKQGYTYYKLDSLGRKLEERSKIFDEDTSIYFYWYPQFKYFDENNLVAIKQLQNEGTPYTDTSKYWFAIESYDLDFNLKSKGYLKNSGLFKNSKLNIFSKILSPTRFISEPMYGADSVINYLYDELGTLLAHYELRAPNGLPVFLSKALVLKDGRILIGGSTINSNKKNINNQFCFYLIDSDNSFKFLKSFDFSPVNHYLRTTALYETPSGDILVNGYHEYNVFKANGDFEDWYGYYANWILFKAEDLGLKTNTTDFEINNEELSVHPNPSSDKVFIQSKDEENSHYQVFDLFGRKIINSKSNEIDISELKSGVYFVIGLNNNSRYLGKGKFVKL